VGGDLIMALTVRFSHNVASAEKPNRSRLGSLSILATEAKE
jgi:hypothetical protein